MVNSCALERCQRPAPSGRLCKAHANRLARTGDVRADDPIRNPVKGGPDAQFWAKVDKGDECWIWTATRNASGYGQWTEVANGRKLWKAHRRSWTLHFGPIPDGMQVCHHCDNPPCVRPSHLFLGTALVNARDKVSKGRMKRGDFKGVANGHAKLTEADVLRIRADVAAGTRTQASFCREFGMNSASISDIVNRKNWRHI